jgi:phosphatidylglycerophosphate synthase
VTVVRGGPIVGLVGQAVLLAAVAATVGLTVNGALIGLGFALVLAGLLPARLGPADLVTLARTVLVGAITAIVTDSLDHHMPAGPLVALAAVALVLDGVDGAVARRTRTESSFGARFDMEVDAFLILVMSIYVAPILGAWVLAIGAMRYVFVAATWVLPWMRSALPPRWWRKVVAAGQGIALTVAAAGLLPTPVSGAIVAAALALLVESFGRDVWWLWRRRPVARLSAAEMRDAT